MIDVLSLDAEIDLDNIWFYGVGKWGLKQADNYQDKLLEMIEYILSNPHIGKERENIKEGYRSYVIGSHTIYYRRCNDSIRVLRILHHSVDYQRHFIN